MSDRDIEITCFIDCPTCEKSTLVTFTALITSGNVPQTRESCGHCGAGMTIEANLDIGVTPHDH